MLFLCCCLSWAETALCQADSPFIHVEVSMDAHGFMCPFLTPMFLGFLEDRGAAWVSHDPDASVIEFAMPLDSLHSSRDFTEMLVLIGYEEDQVGYARFDTTAAMPSPPTP